MSLLKTVATWFAGDQSKGPPSPTTGARRTAASRGSVMKPEAGRGKQSTTASAAKSEAGQGTLTVAKLNRERQNVAVKHCLQAEEEQVDEDSFQGDKLGYAVRKVFVKFAGSSSSTLDMHQLTFLSIVVCDELGLSVQKRPEWTQVIIGLFHHVDKAHTGMLNEDGVVELIESALEYFGVPLPGAVPIGIEGKAGAAHFRKLTERHAGRDLKLKVHEVFVRYAGEAADGSRFLTVGEMGFLSIMLAGELDVDVGRFPDWVSTVTELCDAVVDDDEAGYLNEVQVTDVMETAFRHYGVDRDIAPGENRSTALMPLLKGKPKRKAAPPAQTTLKYAARRGSTRLEVTTTTGFAVGDQVVIGNRDRQRITSLTPFAVSSPLLYDHAAGTQVACVPQGTVAGARQNSQQQQGVLPFKDVHDEYELQEKMGQGGQGTVYWAKESGTGYARVVKFYSKKNAPTPPSEDAKAEFLTLQSLDHPKIQRLYDVFEDPDNVYVVGEPYTGGDLTKLASKAQQAGVQVTPIYLLRVMRQLFEGVKYLHKHLIEHCDLKEQNVMVARDDQWHDPHIVVIDFGLSRHFKDGHMQGGGTPGYIPPEVWRDPLAWSAKGDVHSLGVILYQMYGAPSRPYQGTTILEIKQATLEQPVDFRPVQQYPCLPELLGEMLDKDPANRPKVAHCLETSFFLRDLGAGGHAPLPEDTVNGMMELGRADDIRAAMLADIAGRLNLAEMTELSDTFLRLDANDDGFVSAEELHDALAAEGMDAVKVESIVRQVTGPDGRIPYSTFMGQMIASRHSLEHAVLRQEFCRLDINGDGFVDSDELQGLLEGRHLAELLGTRNVQQLMARMDTNHDGKVSWEEFSAVLQGEKDPAKQARQKKAAYTGQLRKRFGAQNGSTPAVSSSVAAGGKAVTSKPVQKGATSLEVDNAAAFRPGDRVVVDGGKAEPSRTITRIIGNSMELDRFLQHDYPVGTEVTTASDPVATPSFRPLSSTQAAPKPSAVSMPVQPQKASAVSMPAQPQKVRLSLDEARIGPAGAHHAATIAPPSRASSTIASSAIGSSTQPAGRLSTAALGSSTQPSGRLSSSAATGPPVGVSMPVRHGGATAPAERRNSAAVAAGGYPSATSGPTMPSVRRPSYDDARAMPTVQRLPSAVSFGAGQTTAFQSSAVVQGTSTSRSSGVSSAATVVEASPGLAPVPLSQRPSQAVPSASNVVGNAKPVIGASIPAQRQHRPPIGQSIPVARVH